MIYKLFLLSILFVFPCEALAKIAVQFQANATVTGSRIVLGDIATIRYGGELTQPLSQLPVASSPAPGKTKELYTPSVINSLRNRKEVVDVDWQGSPTINVQRLATTISKTQIESILGRFLQENSDRLPKAEIRLTILRSPEEVIVPAGTLSWKVTPSKAAIFGSSSFSIAFNVDGRSAGNCIVRVRLVALGEVAVAATSLRKGEILSPSSIRLEKRDLGDLDEPFTETGDLLGLEAAKTISAGTVLDHDNITAPSIIRRGEMVTIIARRGPMQLTTKGLAKADGHRGQMIKVKNISSNKMIYCRVDRPGVVSVEF